MINGSAEEAQALAALLDAPGVRPVLSAITDDDDQAWLVGGCVRNALMGTAASDIDIASQAEPPVVAERLERAGIKVVPTGLDHGTVTAIVDHIPLEVTSLRRDVETDGRRAVVAFSRDITEDASRRDFTMNALYVDGDGLLHDPLNGLGDLRARRVRFIGDAAMRIREDYLRALRFFRFYAWYGHGAPDRDAVKAIVSHKEGLSGLSAERVWSELKKILQAPQVTRGLLWMRQTGVYQAVLPESGDMDAFARFHRLEDAVGIEGDALLRLQVLLPPGRVERVRGLADRLKLANAERERLKTTQSLMAQEDTTAISHASEVRKLVYTNSQSAVRDALFLQATLALDADPEVDLPTDVVERLADNLRIVDDWHAPSLPVSGQDLLDHGIEPGPQLGAALKIMEGAWVASDFALGRDELLAVLKT